MGVHALLYDAVQRLVSISDSPHLDAEVLLSHVTGKNRTWFVTWPEAEVDASSQARFQQLIEQRSNGIPVAYLTGQREFWSREFLVTPDTLIPRPETELLIEIALHHAATCPASPLRIADLGTGSGAIAVTLALELPLAQIYAVDISVAALAIARQNAENLGARNALFLEGNWLQPLADQAPFDLIVSNPPYVATNDGHLSRGDIRFEPPGALASGADGLDDIRHIIANAQSALKSGGWLLLEHGYDQGQAVQLLLEQARFINTAGYQDLSGHGRVSCGQKAGA
jgi:release factor glutamine methyltransferase